MSETLISSDLNFISQEKVYKGKVGVSKSMNDQDRPMSILTENDQITFRNGNTRVRRIVGN